MHCSQHLLRGQDAKEARDQEYIDALRSSYLMHGKSRREMRPIKKRVRTVFFHCRIWPEESELSLTNGSKWRFSAQKQPALCVGRGLHLTPSQPALCANNRLWELSWMHLQAA